MLVIIIIFNHVRFHFIIVADFIFSVSNLICSQRFAVVSIRPLLRIFVIISEFSYLAFENYNCGGVVLRRRSQRANFLLFGAVKILILIVFKQLSVGIVVIFRTEEKIVFARIFVVNALGRPTAVMRPTFHFRVENRSYVLPAFHVLAAVRGKSVTAVIAVGRGIHVKPTVIFLVGFVIYVNNRRVGASRFHIVFIE